MNFEKVNISYLKEVLKFLNSNTEISPPFKGEDPFIDFLNLLINKFEKHKLKIIHIFVTKFVCYDIDKNTLPIYKYYFENKKNISIKSDYHFYNLFESACHINAEHIIIDNLDNFKLDINLVIDICAISLYMYPSLLNIVLHKYKCVDLILYAIEHLSAEDILLCDLVENNDVDLTTKHIEFILQKIYKVDTMLSTYILSRMKI